MEAAQAAVQLMLASDQLQAQISYGLNVGARIRKKDNFFKGFYLTTDSQCRSWYVVKSLNIEKGLTEIPPTPTFTENFIADKNQLFPCVNS